jgi:hypothetical protein
MAACVQGAAMSGCGRQASKTARAHAGWAGASSMQKLTGTKIIHDANITAG